MESSVNPSVDWVFRDLAPSLHVKLFDDIDFIYEARLARLEAETWQRNMSEFRKRTSYCEEVNGEKSHHYFISGIKGKGQIGHSNQYLTHWYYPYKAKFHPQMVKALMNWMGLGPGQIVLDPFAGSGTTLVEANLIGVNGIGIDIDPLCRLISQVKTSLLTLTPVDLRTLDLGLAFDYFHHIEPQTAVAVEQYLTGSSPNAIPRRGFPEIIDQRVYDFYLLSYLYALSDNTYVGADMKSQFRLNITRMMDNLSRFQDLRLNLELSLGRSDMIHGNACTLKDIVKESVDGIVTSPPYSTLIDYIAQDMHALKYLHINPEKLRGSLVGLRGSSNERTELYFRDMATVFQQMFEILRPSKYCSMVVGDVSYGGTRPSLCDSMIESARDAGFEHLERIRRPIVGGQERIRYEYILMFRKP